MKVDGPWSPDASQLGVDRGPPPTDATSRAASHQRASGHCRQNLLACEQNTGRLECGLPALEEEAPLHCARPRRGTRSPAALRLPSTVGQGGHPALLQMLGPGVAQCHPCSLEILAAWDAGFCRRSWPTRPSGLAVLGATTNTLESSKSHTWNTIPVSLQPILLRGPLPGFLNAVAFAGVHRQPAGGSLTGL